MRTKYETAELTIKIQDHLRSLVIAIFDRSCVFISLLLPF